MATQIQPPTAIDFIQGVVGSVFLAGSIEQGKAKPWQDEVWLKLKDIPALAVLNPRRKAWDSSWKQERGANEFTRQVEWELSSIEQADVVAFYFQPDTKCPITLAELGIISHRLNNFPPKAIVCCPTPFWRRGNVEIMCHRYNHKMVDTLDELVEEIKKEFAYTASLDAEGFNVAECRLGWNKSHK